MTRRVVAGNWKMNTTLADGVQLMRDIASLRSSVPHDVELIVCPPFTHLATLALQDRVGIRLGAQDCAAQEKGAFTGDVSAEMVRGCGAEYTIIGHSERRMYHAEGEELLLAKMLRAHEAGLGVIYCVGEPLDVRERGEEEAWTYVEHQLEVLAKLPADLRDLIVAYEPIWAIGTGRTASPEQAGCMCRRIAEDVSRFRGNIVASVPVLYGGSCNPSNARELFAQPGISGGLIGGAALKANDFAAIASSF